MVRETPDTGIVRLRDVARIELGSQDYSVMSRLNGQPSAAVATYQLPGSNAVEAAETVSNLMSKMKQRFPPDMDYAVAVDQTQSVTEGIKEILKTLVIALVLVILVVYIFLQGVRATLIPLLAVPVSLVGTFVLFPAFGFSINTLSLFGLVLAIGLVVDDAIVVVEGVERHIEEGMTSKAAALKAMEELPARSSESRWFSPPYLSPPLSFQALRGALPAIRGNHRDFGTSVGVQRAHAQPSARSLASSTQKQTTDWSGSFSIGLTGCLDARPMATCGCAEG